MGAVEVVAEKSPTLIDRLKKLCAAAAEKTGEIAVRTEGDRIRFAGRVGRLKSSKGGMHETTGFVPAPRVSLPQIPAF